jgi:hypothetical protein
MWKRLTSVIFLQDEVLEISKQQIKNGAGFLSEMKRLKR